MEKQFFNTTKNFNHTAMRTTGFETGTMPKIITKRHVEIESLYDENIKLKQELQKRKKVFNRLRTSYSRLEESQKKNTRRIENVLAFVDSLPEEEKIGDGFTDNSEKLNKLKEIYVTDSIRTQLKAYQDQLIEKDDEILRLKEDFKFSRFQNVEIRYNAKCEEFDALRVQFDILKRTSMEREKLLNDKQDEVGYLKVLVERLKQKKEELEKYNKSLEESLTLAENRQMRLKERVNKAEFKELQAKKAFKQAENDVTSLKEKIDEGPKEVKDEKTLKQLKEMQGKLRRLKENDKRQKEEFERKIEALKKEKEMKEKEFAAETKKLKEKLAKSEENIKIHNEREKKNEANKNTKRDELQIKIEDFEIEVTQLKAELEDQREGQAESLEKRKELETEIKALKEEKKKKLDQFGKGECCSQEKLSILPSGDEEIEEEDQPATFQITTKTNLEIS